MRISFDGLGRPEIPGWVEVRGVGRILVSEENLQEALELDGRVAWDLELMSPSEFTDREFGAIKHYVLGAAIPLKELEGPDSVPPEMTPPVQYPKGDEEFPPWLKEFLANLPTVDRLLSLPQERVEALEAAAATYLDAIDTKQAQVAKRQAMAELDKVLQIIDRHPDYSETIAATLGLMPAESSNA